MGTDLPRRSQRRSRLVVDRTLTGTSRTRWGARVRTFGRWQRIALLAAMLVFSACGQSAPDSQVLSGNDAPAISSPTRCPSPVGLEEPGPSAAADALRALDGIR